LIPIKGNPKPLADFMTDSFVVRLI